ncbi:MAG: hypothetical protein IKF79_08980 [Methanosphaera sp.]|nr:hypothetical protein [Methanosphaera sp.]
MSFLHHVVLPDNSEYDLKGTLISVVGTQSTDGASWTGNLPIDAVTSGTTIAYYLPRTSGSNVTLNLTLNGTNNSTGPIPVYFQGNTRLSTQYAAGSVVVMTYYAAGDISIGGTATTDNRWTVVGYVNTNNAVTQTESSGNADYELLFSESASGSGTLTEGARKDADLKYNPSTNTLTASNISASKINGVTLGDNPEFTDTTYSAGTGISLGGADNTVINHTNSVTAQTTQGIYPVKIDAQGHISAYGTVFTPGAAATKGVATSISSSSTDNDLATAKAVNDALEGLPEPMQFKGTVGTGGTIEWANLPQPASTGASKNEGFTYKALSARSKTDTPTLTDDVKVGDTIISNGTNWVVVPSGDEPSGTVTQVDIAVTSGNTGVVVGGGPITSSGTLTVGHADTSSQASVVPTTNTFVDGVTLDDYGHVTALHTSSASITDANVKQSPTTNTSQDLRVLLSHSANDTEETSGVYKDSDLKYNPVTNDLSVTKINGQTVGASPKFTDSVTTVAYNKTNGTGTFSQTKDGTTTDIFTTSDGTVTQVKTWSAGAIPTFVVSGETLTINAGSLPSLTTESANVVQSVSKVTS